MSDRTRPNGFKGILEIGVARAQHRREAGRLHLAPAPFARLLEVPMVTHFLQGPFPVDFLFQPAQGLVNRFTFFKLNFCQSNSLPLRDPGMQAMAASTRIGRAKESKSHRHGCQRPKNQKRACKAPVLWTMVFHGFT